MKALHSYTRCILLYIVELLVLPASVYAQQAGLKLYNINDGLPNTAINRVYQDKYGYLWVGTPAGLSRFDGRQFVNYGISDGLPSLSTGIIFQDSRERLWIGTVAGIAEFRNNRFIAYPTSDSLPNAYVFNFIETKDKQLWALTGKGVYQFADSFWKKISLLPGLENNPCRGIIEINGELYVNYAGAIYHRNAAGKWTRIASQENYTSIFNVMSVQNGEIWVSTDANIFRIINEKLVPLYSKNISAFNFFSYLVDSRNCLWLAGEDLFKRSQPGDWTRFPDAEVNQNGVYSFIIEDASHNIWITSTDGLLKIKDITPTIIKNTNPVPLDGIYNIIPLPDSGLLFSSGTHTGLSAYRNNGFKQIPAPRAAGNENYYRDPVDAYAFDDKNNLWMVTRFKKCLRFVAGKVEDHTNALHLKTSEHIYDIGFSKKRKKLFICADSTLLSGYDEKFSTFIPANTGVPLVKPTRVHELKNGLLIVYIDEKGVYSIDAANNLHSLIGETGIDGSKKGIQLSVCFYEDSSNSFWIAMPGMGLYEYGFSESKLPFLKNHITIKDGIQSDNLLSLVNDRQNRIWLATNAGLDILQKNNSGKWDVFNYASAQDLGIVKSDYGKLITDKEGNILLSSPTKIVKFNSAGIRLFNEPPRIIIEKVSLAFKETDWSKLTDSLYSYYRLPYHPELSHKQNSIGIFFNAIDFSVSNSNPEYSYKILPLDTSWSTPSKIKSVSFTQLHAGKYQFFVRARDRASGWSQPASFQFTVNPPFWERWWFRLMIIAVVAFLIVLIFKSRIQKIRREAFFANQLKDLEMKALKAQMNPHFIYNALNSIQALVANDKKKESIHYIGSFSRLLRHVLDNSEYNVISLYKELETIGLYVQLEELRLDMPLQYKTEIAENIVTEFEKIPPLILQPFVENALWHGLSRKEGEKEIIIAVSVLDEWLRFEISDNGIGREKSREWKSQSFVLHQSKAIDITRKRLIDFNGPGSVSPIEFTDLYDSENNPSGTRVSLRIKRKP